MKTPTDTHIYRLADPAALAAASLSGQFEGEALDHADGFIHCSRKDQVAETLNLHFTSVEKIALASVRVDALGVSLKWEKSRGGEIFPHVYGAIPFSAIDSVRLLKRNDAGEWVLPEEMMV